MKFNKKLQTIFLDVDSKEFKLQGKVNIVLSPSFYWVKKLSLPVKYIRDAKKLLPSIFEDSIPEGQYSYSVYKQGDYFIAFAYQDKFILDTLSQKGLKNSNINNIYFAQSEFQNTEMTMKIDKEQTLCFKDDILILLPATLFEKSKALNLSDIKHSKYTINLAQFGHIVDNKSIYKIGAILVSFILLLMVELFITTEKTQEIILNQEELFTKYKLKPTMFQNKSMLKKYRNIHIKQMKIREYNSAILSLKLKNDDKLTNLILKDKLLLASFSGVEKGSEKYLIKMLKKIKIDFKSFFKNKKFNVEMKL